MRCVVPVSVCVYVCTVCSTYSTVLRLVERFNFVSSCSSPSVGVDSEFWMRFERLFASFTHSNTNAPIRSFVFHLAVWVCVCVCSHQTITNYYHPVTREEKNGKKWNENNKLKCASSSQRHQIGTAYTCYEFFFLQFFVWKKQNLPWKIPFQKMHRRMYFTFFFSLRWRRAFRMGFYFGRTHFSVDEEKN